MLMLIPGDEGGRFRKELYANTGCSSSLCNTWRKPPIQCRDIPKTDAVEIDPLLQIFIMTLGRQWVCSDVMQLTVLGWVGELVERGMPKEKAEQYKRLALSYMAGCRDGGVHNFMG